MIIALAIAAILAFLFYASYSIKSQVYVRALCRVKTTEKVVYLTFDDGPNAEQTPQVLDVLKRNNAKATFFCIGSRIAGNEHILKRIIDEGHTIGNHSFSHTNSFPLFSRRRMIADIEQCQKAIENTIGTAPTLFRPPFGVTNPTVGKAVKTLNLKTIGWTIRTYDTNRCNNAKIARRISRQLRPGAIILLHDRLPQSAERLQMVIDTVKENGYEIGDNIGTQN
ncbi:MAG: polysaccharide deacetylase family protein [Salinivirgaceae bacterium]|nr:polysaccharide deacetylase family protein [Salinivirgaceae bacterium]